MPRPPLRTTYREQSEPHNIRPGASSRAEVALDQESYYLPLIEALAAFHAPCVAKGLRLYASDDGALMLTPGVGIDGLGRIIVLSETGYAEVGTNPDAPGASPQLAAVTADGVRIPTDGLTGGRIVVVHAWETFDQRAFSDTGAMRFAQTPWVQLVTPVVEDYDDLSKGGVRLVIGSVGFGEGANAGRVASVSSLREPRPRLHDGNGMFGSELGIEFRRHPSMRESLKDERVGRLSQLYGNVASVELTATAPGFLVTAPRVLIDGNLEVKGTATFHGPKVGFLVDAFRNGTDRALEVGDVVVVADGAVAIEGGGPIPVADVAIATTPYDSRACGIVHNGAAPGAQGHMVTLGCWRHCKVDADVSPIAAGDLLTTSATPGHAQKVVDRARALGAVLGKALAPLSSGKGVIPVLVSLH